MSQHTKGPWRACNDGECRCLTVSAPDQPIAKVISDKWGDDYPALRLVGPSSLEQKVEAYMEQITYGEIDPEEAKANARLIAAAPDLLEACKAAIANSEKTLAEDGGFRQPEAQHVFDMVSAAIAKAEGK